MTKPPSLHVLVRAATAADASEIADIHLSARREIMPYLKSPFTEAEVRAWFARTVGTPAGAWQVAQSDVGIAGYLAIYGERLDHLYVRPELLRRRVGVTLLDNAKAMCPGRLELRTFQRNLDARAFYEARGFQAAGLTDGENDEREPDVKYVWLGAS